MKQDTNLVESVFTFSRLLKEEMSYDSRLLHLSLLQLQALVYVHSHTDCQMSEIANHFKIELPSATSLMNKLQTLHLVQRNADKKDRRLVRISLTKKGEILFADAMKERSIKITGILKHLSDNDKKSLQEILQKLITKLEKNHEK